MSLPKFHDRILHQITTLNAVSETVGPGRMARCDHASVQIHFGAGSSQGTAEVQWSAHQSFPGSPIVVGSVAWSVADSGDAVDVPSKYFNGFIRVKLVGASDGQGVSAWASGR